MTTLHTGMTGDELKELIAQELDDEWDEIYGSNIVKKVELIMATGGSHAWEYVIYEDGQLYIHRHMKDEEHQFNKKLIEREDGQIKMVDTEYKTTGDEWEYYDKLMEWGGFYDPLPEVRPLDQKWRTSEKNCQK
tara:strand:- start:690 stop:1091 length:402 start_codon:yes stop_codon:yes gene_type:complete